MISRQSLLFIFCILSTFSCSIQPSNQENQYTVIPKPQSLTPLEGQFYLEVENSIEVPAKDAQFKWAIENFNQFLKAKKAPVLNQKATDQSAKLRLQIKEELPQEGYELSIAKEGLTIRSSSAQGLFYAFQTLKQLLAQDEKGWYFPAAEIKDEPRFPYRGMHLDVARHFHPVETVKAMIDQLAYHKINTFHWHLTEDQGWRIEIKKYPKLTEVGAYRNGTLVGHYNDQPRQFDGKRYGGFFTQEEIKDIVQYAAHRFIEVIPEIELPGHAQAAIAAYPELGCTGESYEVWQMWGISENVYCPTEATFEFLEGVFDEVVALFPSKYIHIGGDECPKIQWKESAFCQELMRKEGLKDEYELQSYFIRRIEKYLNSKGKQIIGWDEILEGGVAPNATVMSWRGLEGGIEAAKAGHDVIMTPTSNCYLDYYQSDHPDEPLAIGGYLPLKKVYDFEPIPAELSPEESKHILGSQVNVWTEYIPTREKLEYMIFPRLCASAEVGWSAPEKDFDNFVQRLAPHLGRLEEMGIRPANHLYDIKSKTTPCTDKACLVNNGQISIKLDILADDAQILYTTDGKQPNPTSQKYNTEIPVSQSQTIKAQSFQNGKSIGRPWSQTINWHIAAGKAIALSKLPHPKYGSGGPSALINGIEGSNVRYGDAEWLGFDGKDCEAIIDLGKERAISKASFRFFNGEGQWIYLPKKVKISSSKDGENFEEIALIPAIEGEEKVIQPSIAFPTVNTQFIKIEIENYGIIPDGAQGAGNAAWLFVDEIRIE